MALLNVAKHSGRVFARRTLAVLALVCGLAVTGGAAHVSAQADVVQPEDVTSPASPPVALPTPTPSGHGSSHEHVQVAANSLVSGSADYVVREGDTLWTAALEMGLDLDVMPCVVDPFFRTDQPLVIGNVLTSPAGELLCHQTAEGETVASIAAAYDVRSDDLLADAWNALDPQAGDENVLEPGRYVRIIRRQESDASPGFFAYMLGRPIAELPLMALAQGGPARSEARALVPDDWPYGSGQFDWPSPGWLTQGYRNDHRAVDIAAPPGTVVVAADRGVVIRSGWNNQGYGMFVVIDHNIDYVTLYSHLEEIFVEEGEVVGKGQALGTVGSTGNSTGPHLHFEVRDFGSRINPLEVLVR